ncbi:MAG: oligosaccharide flippase family protein [Tannerellaceae bacterium]|nr:oligosaccharide flippase family protein [Tannerellaceae bacterium]
MKGTFLLTAGSVISKGLLALAYIILARILTTSEYGEYGILRSTMDNLLVFASMGIGLTTTKYISELKHTDKSAASSILGTSLGLVFVLSFIVFLTLLIFSTPVSTGILKNESLTYPLIIAGGILIFISLNSIQSGALLGLQSYRDISVVHIVQGILLFAGLCIGGYYHGVTGAITGNLLGMVVLYFFTHHLLIRRCKTEGIHISFHDWRKYTKLIYKFAIPASLSTFIVAPTIWILNTMLVNQPNGYYQLGLYSAVIIFTMAIQMLNGSIGNVLLPMFLADKTALSHKKAFVNYFGTWIITILLSIPLIVFPELVSFILGNKYPVDSIRTILFLSIFSTIIIAHKQGIARDLIIKNKMWLSVFSMGLWAVSTFLLFTLLKGYGAMGFAWSYCLGYIINYLLFTPFFIYKKISPAYIFYNKWVVGVWIWILLLTAINFSTSAYFLRLFSLPVIGLFPWLIHRLYGEICKNE